MHASPPSEPERVESSTDSHDQPLKASSLRGTFVFVLIMAALFAASWFGLLALAMSRR